jgi:hypothetical protein
VIGQPLRNVEAFMVDGKMAVPAAGRDDDRGAGVFLLRWQVDRQRRVVDFHERVFVARPGDHHFLFGLTFGTGSAVGPQRDGQWIPRQAEGRQQQESAENFAKHDRTSF